MITLVGVIGVHFVVNSTSLWLTGSTVPASRGVHSAEYRRLSIEGETVNVCGGFRQTALLEKVRR
jgi:hypothetical protein